MTDLKKLKAELEAAHADRNAALDVAYAAFDAARDAFDAAVDAANADRDAAIAAYLADLAALDAALHARAAPAPPMPCYGSLRQPHTRAEHCCGDCPFEAPCDRLAEEIRTSRNRSTRAGADR
jgi:hypothetical protein